MKRHTLFCVLLVSIMLLTACVSAISGRKPPQPSPSEPPAAASPAPTTTPAPVITPEPSAAPPEEPSAVPEPSMEAVPEAQPESTPEPTPEPTPEASAVTPPPTENPSGYAQIDLTSSAILGETEDMGQAYIDDIVFLGDSTTYGMKYYAVLSGGKETKQVWTPSSGTLTLSYQGFAAIVYPDEDVEITIREAVERKKPKMMVITLGVNGVSFMGRDDFLTEYTDLVTDIMEISPETKVIIQSIFPIASNYEYQSSINNRKICEANTWLLEVAENTGAKYLNTISVLMGEDGFMPSAYQNGDGLHLNTEGFTRVLNYIRTHGWA